jgi:hypothetical protein
VAEGDEEMLFPLAAGGEGGIASARELFRNVSCMALDCALLPCVSCVKR